ncbi:hypothetical protein ACFY1P_24700 [Streptomyces sp. NPDC001407]
MPEPHEATVIALTGNGGTKSWFHYSVGNSCGHKWIYLRVHGTKAAG